VVDDTVTGNVLASCSGATISRVEPRGCEGKGTELVPPVAFPVHGSDATVVVMDGGEHQRCG